MPRVGPRGADEHMCRCRQDVASYVSTKLHAAAFRRTASVVRNWRHIANGAHLNTRGGERAHGRLAARTWTADADIYTADAVIARHIRGARCRLLSGDRCAFARSAEAERSRTLPRQNVAIHIGNSHDRVVEGRLHVAQAMRHVFAFLLLERLFLAFFLRGGGAARCCWFSHS